ncbi:SNF1-interacting protein [Vermiconidia calcicola]|uniref:SNF1-interacting protein n=1 Tax=Vermiconidia calcicola TaxID=1690605 RepID=A0ACC3NUN9_9PEZI|nr:SNF1-interacting protein [Vermiconidia calcicola]
MAEDIGQTSVKPVEQPLNLIPVGLKEAALDSPTFRATALHFADQIEIIERWLDGYVKAAAKLVTDISSLETSVNNFLTQAAPPSQVSEAVLDHDYTLLAMRRYGEGAREFWNQTFRGVKKYDTTVIEPIKTFLNTELKAFKDARRVLDLSQKSFDSVIARYLSQSKAKESSSLREDAFQVHEARKAYLKASMDFCIVAPQLRTSLDQLIVKVFSEQFKEMRVSRDASAAMFTRLSGEMERVKGWSREMENSERAFKRELATARRQIEDSASVMTRPSRELGDYETSTVPYLGTGASTATGMRSSTKSGLAEKGEKQGWLLLKTVVNKPARTVWSRRWFFVKNGIFGWLVQGSRSGGVEESEKIGVLLCGVRPAFQEERRFCFEVKTKDQSIILQSETQIELTEWLSAFEVAKKKALQDPDSTEASPLSADPAFAITAPVAPEFAARVGDGANERPEDAPTGLAIPDHQGTGLGMPPRASFDVNAARRITSLEREPGEGGRDHAARIIQKLDLHKRSTATPQLSQAPAPAGGIASLISASHNVLPIRPETPVTPGPAEGTGHKRNITPSTLAPSTLANPPAPTNLSHTAVVVSGERGLSLGGRADGSGMPSGIMANLWGSSNWGYVNRLGDDLSKTASRRKSISQPPSSQHPALTTMDDNAVLDGTGELSRELSPQPQLPEQRHRKSMSAAAATDLDLPSQVAKVAKVDEGDQYPNYYPLPLKAQQAQFKMLFPSVPRAEKVVLVFRATWNPNEQQEFPGRVYVTAKEIYFYSNHLGFVLITGVSLNSIGEVTAAPGRDCDFLYLHLKERDGENDRRRITIRVFLDSLRLLQRRLHFLVQNANADDPVSLEEILKTLIKLEVEKHERSSSIESWEDLADEAAGGEENSPGRRRERNIKASLRIDGNLYGEAAKTGKEVQKFQLPRQAVVYAPQGMQAGTAREFNVSAKALFHVMFGDKSAVFQLLYCNRWANKIVQSPWTKDAETAGGHWARQFASQGHATPMADTQIIDIFNDHLCYVVTNKKYPWRLPYANRFHLVTKLVITHVAKSKCKLAIFQQVNWVQPPSMVYLKHLIEKQALNALEADASDLTNVAMDQVAKLGNHSKTNKAIEIFGNVGQQWSVPTVVDVSAVPGLVKQAKAVSLVKLIASDAVVRVLRAFGMALDVVIALGKGVVGLCTAHTLLVGLLLASVLYNSWYGYRDGLVWWHERNASKYMSRLGVRPEPVMTKAVYLTDIDAIVTPTVNDTLISFSDYPGVKSCRSTFGEQVLSPSTSLIGTGARLHRSRDAMARYRHDLLVALKVVNRIERDMVLAEWEDWVQAEEKKCARVESMLVERRKKSKKDGKAKGKGKGGDLVSLEAELGADFAGYCASCRDELAGLGAGMSLM